MLNLSGLKDIPKGLTGPRSLSPNPLLTNGPDSRISSDPASSITIPIRPNLHTTTSSHPVDPSPVGEPSTGNPIGTPAAEPTPKPYVRDGYLTTRFEHAQTDEGFIVLTGRQGEITKCEDEPIRVPGAIQAFGVLIAVNADNHQEVLQISRVEVVQVSENSGLILGHSPQSLLQLHSFSDILSPDEAQVLYDNLEVTLEGGQEEAGAHTFRLSGQGGRGSGLDGRSSHSTWTCWCAAHRPEPIRRPALIIVEFELETDTINPPSIISREPLSYDERGGMAGEPYLPTEEDLIESTRSVNKPIKALSRLRKKGKDFSGDSVEVLSILSQVNEQFDKAKDLPSFLKMSVGVVRELTGFHRVMVYQFDENWNGQVVAELVDWKQTRDLYRGLRFPSTDIPAQARDLYLINKVRMLYDRDMPTARLMCRSPEEVNTPLDMTHCHLRAMSPIHIKYLANMGVRASFSISIICNNALWGLISCHSYGRYGHRVTFPTRHFCRMLGDSISRNIERLNLSHRLESRKLINTAATAANPSGYIVAKAEDLLWLFDAEFGVLSIGDEAKILGPVHNSQELLAVLEYLRVKSFNSMQVSTDISQEYADIAYPATFQTICGMLVIPLSRGGQDFIAFFRQGQLKEIHWAGNPYEKDEKAGRSPTASEESYAHLRTLEPRKSFKIWSETVRGRSKNWTEEQLETGSVLSLVYGKFIDVWRQKEAAVHTNQLQTLLLSNASHEVRTPLHQILSTLELALDGNLDDETRDNLSRSYHASKSLVHVINDLLDLTKAEQGGDLFSREPFHLASTIEEAISIHRREAERKGLQFHVIESPNCAPVTVAGDRARLRQVVSNLVGNAVKHTTHGTVQVYWGDEATESDQGTISEEHARIFVSVTDTGRGIPEAKLESIFRAFEQVETGESIDGTQPEESLGLGLAVVGRVVHNLGGQLRVDSKVNQGSKFTIILPFAVVVPSASGGSAPSRRGSLSTSDNSPAMLRNRSDDSNAANRSLLAKRSSTGSVGSGSGGHRSEIDGLVEAIQGPVGIADTTAGGLRTPFSPNRTRLRSPVGSSNTPARAYKSTEDTGSSSSSHSALGWPGASRFEWPHKTVKLAGNSNSKSRSLTPKGPSSDSSAPAKLTHASLAKIETDQDSHQRSVSHDALVSAESSKLGYSSTKRDRKADQKITYVPNRASVISPLRIGQATQTTGSNVRARQSLSGLRSDSVSVETGSMQSHEPASIKSAETTRSTASSNLMVDHISNFTRSVNSRVVSKEPMRVMVVEDDAINRVILKKKLTQSGHAVALTVHGQEAVELFSKDAQFDIILMDLQMPICDGLEATRRIREFEKERTKWDVSLPKSHRINCGVPILAVSASLHERQRAEITDAGMDGWILKPVDFARLSSLMVGAIDPLLRSGQVYNRPGMWEKGGYLEVPERRLEL
ncbi:uncharacterized protein MELLADRAFT_39867 [Melampsora larici-populina 98AG31]|uniref:Uncharacterized protein n=1 Tax=Melampsora larici-populina (strain 98AG31 / pathotype 3-4-7) TaxID=747676 RepID=F4S5A3_MELLP|nr:uncharacterized protein MELLADRAFT_39867 [Melampsora larici-populina 98AG31]EGG00131.1 hypothetical protein MELLADRAFT_39867 [Melampsora larici-populina 98AG31]